MDGSPADVAAKPFWLEREFWLLAVLVGLTHFVALDQPSLRGEESRWAQVSGNILSTGDWIVPRQQDLPFLSRPPLQCWLIIFFSKIRGEIDPIAVRLPSVLATLFTSLIIYGYGRRFLAPVGALAAGLGFGTMLQIIQLGRLAESDALFTFLLSSALLLWHWGYQARWHPALFWTLGYSLAGLSMLVKGLQGPTYFCACVGMFLLLRWDWKSILSPWHFLGIGILCTIVGSWLVPFYQSEGLASTRRIFMNDIGLRFADPSVWLYINHLIRYPAEVFASCLPWSLLWLGYLAPAMWRSIGSAKPYFFFLVVCFGVTWPTVWPVPRAMVRYYMPLLPILALFGGLVADRAAAGALSLPLWKYFQKGLPALLVLLALGTVAIGYVQPFFMVFMAPYLTTALALAVTLLLLAYLAKRTLTAPNQGGVRSAVLITAGIVMAYNLFFYLPHLHYRANDTRAEVQKAKQVIAEPEALVSVGPVHHLFAYYYKIPIRQVELDGQDFPKDAIYFCYSTEYLAEPKLPFAWQKIAVVPCDRLRDRKPTMEVIVAKKLDVPVTISGN